jgi:diguanylate cyclase (GGDEF)-like protein
VIQCNIRDITDRKQAQDALLKSDALLRELSIRDHLTGLYNRRYVEETLERELLRAARKHLSLGIIMIDVDNFKYFNDTYGHAAGDVILHKLGNLLLKHVRGDDVPSRYGGDEFIIVMPDTSCDVVSKRAKLLCNEARSLYIQVEEKSLEKITLSVGVAVYPKDGTTSTAVLKSADDALYYAKRHGHDRVVIADSWQEED